MLKYAMITIGGGIGAIARFVVGSYIGQRMGARFPYGTFVINLSGSFFVGLIMTVLTEKTQLNPNWRYFIPIGFIGAYTTFSTFEYETLRAFQDGQMATGTLNVVLSVTAGFVMVWLGVLAGRALA
ncbi:MAG TPA: fluoride efflux transporter CrcB [Terriglobales bacterium]|nr:fluoride efflux transporter CrcB [Terriglobales bacterium]